MSRDVTPTPVQGSRLSSRQRGDLGLERGSRVGVAVAR